MCVRMISLWAIMQLACNALCKVAYTDSRIKERWMILKILRLHSIRIFGEIFYIHVILQSPSSLFAHSRVFKTVLSCHESPVFFSLMNANHFHWKDWRTLSVSLADLLTLIFFLNNFLMSRSKWREDIFYTPTVFALL